LARQLFWLQFGLACALLATVAAAAAVIEQRDAQEAARAQVVAVATTVAASSSVLAALQLPDPSTALQSYAEVVRKKAKVDFVVVMSPRGVRYTHPNPMLIGGTFIGHISPATQGVTFTETFTGSLGPSVRAVTPVLDTSGTVRALVAVGVTEQSLGIQTRTRLFLVAGAGLSAILLALAGEWLVSRWLQRHTHGLGAAEIARMYEYYDAVLHAVREGLVLVDRFGRVQLVNDEAVRLLGLTVPASGNVTGQPVTELGLPAPLAELLAGGAEALDEVHLGDNHVVVVNQSVARWQGRRLGTVATFRDRTELTTLSGELDSLRGMADSLRAQNHEAANRLHTVVSLIEMGRPDRAVDFATSELQAAQTLTDRLLDHAGDPVLTALLLGKASEAAERGIELQLDVELPPDVPLIDGRDLVTILGNLLDNAFEATAEAPPPRQVTVVARIDPGSPPEPNRTPNQTPNRTPTDAAAHMEFRVGDSGPGLAEQDVEAAFRRGWSTKTAPGTQSRGLGLALVAQAVRRHGGTIVCHSEPETGAVFVCRIPLPEDAS
jgi:sensor histidine kinase regulating citrate/malate metabolism